MARAPSEIKVKTDQAWEEQEGLHLRQRLVDKYGEIGEAYFHYLTAPREEKSKAKAKLLQQLKYALVGDFNKNESFHAISLIFDLIEEAQETAQTTNNRFVEF